MKTKLLKLLGALAVVILVTSASGYYAFTSKANAGTRTDYTCDALRGQDYKHWQDEAFARWFYLNPANGCSNPTPSVVQGAYDHYVATRPKGTVVQPLQTSSAASSRETINPNCPDRNMTAGVASELLPNCRAHSGDVQVSRTPNDPKSWQVITAGDKGLITTCNPKCWIAPLIGGGITGQLTTSVAADMAKGGCTGGCKKIMVCEFTACQTYDASQVVSGTTGQSTVQATTQANPQASTQSTTAQSQQTGAKKCPGDIHVPKPPTPEQAQPVRIEAGCVVMSDVLVSLTQNGTYAPLFTGDGHKVMLECRDQPCWVKGPYGLDASADKAENIYIAMRTKNDCAVSYSCPPFNTVKRYVIEGGQLKNITDGGPAIVVLSGAQASKCNVPSQAHYDNTYNTANRYKWVTVPAGCYFNNAAWVLEFGAFDPRKTKAGFFCPSGCVLIAPWGGDITDKPVPGAYVVPNVWKDNNGVAADWKFYTGIWDNYEQKMSLPPSSNVWDLQWVCRLNPDGSLTLTVRDYLGFYHIPDEMWQQCNRPEPNPRFGRAFPDDRDRVFRRDESTVYP